MGQPAEMTVLPGQAVMIPTGGMLPAGADAVVMLEYTEMPDEATVMVVKPVAPGDNVIYKGEDIQAGTVIVRSGGKIGATQIGALAACGFTEVSVRKQPRIGILSTGDEVVDIAVKPEGGQVRDINSYALAAMLETIGCSTIRYGIIPDDYQRVLLALQRAVKECDMVLISGGSSVGTRDHTVQAIAQLGAPGVLLHGIAMKPGKPTIYGLIGRVPVFGLPGHPVSALVVCEQMVKPAIELMLGQSSAKRECLVPARVSRNIASTPGRDDFLRVRLRWGQDGYEADPVLGKSGLISTMTQADGLVHIDADSGGLYAGDLVMVVLM
ncbi:MAG: molybdenum cofactor synthesis domain containing protein [Firmicutes bacterium]|nr:molybdenum cofactor synthesis domain containing protein [Bacillota bacterium]